MALYYVPKGIGFIFVELQDLVFASCLTDVVLTKLQKAGRKGEQGNDRWNKGNDRWNKSREVVMQKTGKSSCEKCKARIDLPPTLSNPVFELLRTRITLFVIRPDSRDTRLVRV